MTTVDHLKVSQTSGKDEDPKEKGFFNRPRAGGKTMWDWLNLLGILAIPLILGIATLSFGIQQANLAQQQHENDQKIANQQHEADKQSALDQQEATILQTYIDNIQDLLLNHHLLGSKTTDDVATLARARTLTALQGLDPERKGLLVQFIYEARLIGFRDSTSKPPHGPIINLLNANLSGADLISSATLFGVNLSGANLSRAILKRAHLRGAHLSGAQLLAADLSSADLSFAILIGANLSCDALLNANLSHADLLNSDLSDANLSGATLREAILRGAILSGDNLRGVQNLTQQQLDQVYSCKNAILPPGLTCHHNQ